MYLMSDTDFRRECKARNLCPRTGPDGVTRYGNNRSFLHEFGIQDDSEDYGTREEAEMAFLEMLEAVCA